NWATSPDTSDELPVHVEEAEEEELLLLDKLEDKRVVDGERCCVEFVQERGEPMIVGDGVRPHRICRWDMIAYKLLDAKWPDPALTFSSGIMVLRTSLLVTDIAIAAIQTLSLRRQEFLRGYEWEGKEEACYLSGSVGGGHNRNKNPQKEKSRPWKRPYTLCMATYAG
ncbi:7349_t:CDS:2, partial [Acaulospora colombiana]